MSREPPPQGSGRRESEHVEQRGVTAADVLAMSDHRFRLTEQGLGDRLNRESLERPDRAALEPSLQLGHRNGKHVCLGVVA
jgi:hypothetical protein